MCYGPEKTVTTYLKYLETRILPTSCLSCGFEPKEAGMFLPLLFPSVLVFLQSWILEQGLGICVSVCFSCRIRFRKDCIEATMTTHIYM